MATDSLYFIGKDFIVVLVKDSIYIFNPFTRHNLCLYYYCSRMVWCTSVSDLPTWIEPWSDLIFINSKRDSSTGRYDVVCCRTDASEINQLEDGSTLIVVAQTHVRVLIIFGDIQYIYTYRIFLVLEYSPQIIYLTRLDSYQINCSLRYTFKLF